MEDDEKDLIVQWCNWLSGLIPFALPDHFSAADFIRLAGTLKIGSFSSQCPEGNVSIGIAFFLRSASVNHGCDRNCEPCIVGPQLRLISLRPIDPGEELTISYVNSIDAVQTKADFLRSTYHFSCCCPICSNPTLQSASYYDTGLPFDTTSLDLLEDLLKADRIREAFSLSIHFCHKADIENAPSNLTGRMLELICPKGVFVFGDVTHLRLKYDLLQLLTLYAMDHRKYDLLKELVRQARELVTLMFGQLAVRYRIFPMSLEDKLGRLVN